jgi:hypothetical protein
MCPVPGIIDPVFVKTSQNARFLLSDNERFGLVFEKTGSINSGTGPGGGGGVIIGDHILQEFKHSVSHQIQNLQNCYTTPNKNL